MKKIMSILLFVVVFTTIDIPAFAKSAEERLLEAAKTGNISVVEELLSTEDININYYMGQEHTTALGAAVEHMYGADNPDNHVKIVKLLLEAGADPNCTIRNEEGIDYPLLSHICFWLTAAGHNYKGYEKYINNYIEIIKLLKEANVNYNDETVQTICRPVRKLVNKLLL
jgi:hypothetical protein